MQGIPLLLFLGFALLTMIVGPRRSFELLTQGIGWLLGTALKAAGNLILLTGRLCYEALRGIGGALWQFGQGSGPKVLQPGDRAKLLPSGTIGGGDDVADYRRIAQPKELRALRTGTFRLGRYLHPRGRVGSELFLPSRDLLRHCAVIAPTGAGKTESILVPWCLSALAEGHSVVLVDVKGDLFDRLQGEVQAIGARLLYFNIGDPARSASWNFFNEIEDDTDYDAAVRSILGGSPRNDSQPFFHERDCRWLRALLRLVHAAIESPTPQHLLSLIASRDELRLLANRQRANLGHSIDALSDLLELSREEYFRVTSGLKNKLDTFGLSRVQPVTQHSDFRLTDLSTATVPCLLLIGAPLADTETAEVMSSLILNQLILVLYRRFRHPSDARQIFFLVDEAPNLQARIDYMKVLSLVRGAGVGVCLIAQDVSQFGEQINIDRILSNCNTLILFRGSRPPTAQYLAARLGDAWTEAQSICVQRDSSSWLPRDQVASTSIGRERVPVVAPRDIMYLPTTDQNSRYTALVHAPDLCVKPFLTDLTKSNAE